MQLSINFDSDKTKFTKQIFPLGGKFNSWCRNKIGKIREKQRSDSLKISPNPLDLDDALRMKIKYFYDKAKIPMLAEKSVKDYIWQAYDHNVQFRRSYHSHRLSEKYEKEELERMEKTFVAWPKKTAMKEIKNDTDRNFLSSMMTDRKATIGGKKIHKCFA